MKLQLKPFQEIAATELRKKADQARAEAADDPQVLLLTAPTGAGKTVMAAALLESILAGDETYEPDPDATFLWLTDQPELNEQTAEKFEASSDQFDEDNIETVEAATFDQELFDPGMLYFLNTQKLGAGSSLVHKGDKRKHTIWETISKTALARPQSFWLILDEAHRGMLQNGSHDPETLVQRLVLGSKEHGVPAVPLVLGISATPERFNKLLDKAGSRTRRPVIVEPEDVRGSGLLKDIITLYHIDEDQPGDYSLLAAAALEFKEFEETWAAHKARDRKGDIVKPVLVIQVQDGTGKKGKNRLSRTDLEKAVSTVDEALPDLKAHQVAHAFQEGTQEDFGSQSVRYVKPSHIQADPDLRAVFFKQSLTTGWDCPRAEVMMSFRKSDDETVIAQLVGRMVRNPLGYAVDDPELLSSVCLYLPQYDRDTVESIIERLQKPNPDDGIPGTKETRKGNELVTLQPSKKHEIVFDQLGDLPNYKLQRVARLSPIRRLLRLGDRLAWDGLDKDAKERYERALLTAIAKERKRLAKKPDYDARLKEASLIDVGKHDIDASGNKDVETSTTQVKAVAENIEQAFAQAGRRLAAGFQRTYLKARAEEKDAPPLGTIKRELWVIVSDDQAREAIEAAADALCDRELDRFEARINKEVGEEERVEYRAIRRQGAEPKPEPWSLPTGIMGDKKGETFEDHVFVRADGKFAGKLNNLEKRTLAREREREGFLGWLRNDPRKPWSFSIDYEKEGERKSMYPDFLIFRKQTSHVVADVLEPHSLSQADSVAKVKGLADFAGKHGDDFGRIEFLDEVGKELLAINLKDPEIRKRAKTLEGDAQLKQLLEDHGKA